ncbi:hypothetical protein [Streptomyces platensis]|uniref:hypothetical protein n=1 Tax=Streptomyces platensis TaxID=58346 RepID=UPI0037A92BB1
MTAATAAFRRVLALGGPLLFVRSLGALYLAVVVLGLALTTRATDRPAAVLRPAAGAPAGSAR